MIIIEKARDRNLIKIGEEIDLLVPEVASLVVTHVPLGPEALPASLWALKGSLIDMNPHVDAQILLLTEAFSTAWVRALEGLSAVV